MRIAAAILSAALLAALGSYLWLGTFTRYMTDDYCTAAAVREHGIVEAVLLHRQAWSGRFSFYAIKGSLELVGPETARCVPGLLVVMLAAAAAWSLRQMFRAQPAMLAIAGGLTVAYASIDAAPSRESRFGPFLWETGAVTYMLAAVLLAVWFGVVACRGRWRWCCAASAVLLFVAGGLSETSLAAGAALSASVLALAVAYRSRPAAWIAASGIAGTFAAFAIMATAPGNAIRMATLAPRPGLLAAGWGTLRYANAYVGSDVFVSGASLIVVCVLGLLTGLHLPATSARLAAGCAAAAAIAYVATFAPSAVILGLGPPARALFVTNFLLIVALFAASAWMGLRWSNAPLTGAIAVALLIAAVVPVRSVFDVVRSLPEARSEAHQADAIVASLRQQRGRAVSLLSPWALSSRFATVNASHWTNRCVSRYFDLQSLSVVRR